MTETERLIVTTAGVPIVLVLFLLITWLLMLIVKAYEAIQEQEKRTVRINTTKHKKVYHRSSYIEFD